MSCKLLPLPTSLNSLINSGRTLKHATQIHAHLITTAFLSLPFLFNNLLNLYAKSASLDHTLLLFSSAPHDSKNVVSWTSLITQFSRSKRPFHALTFFNHMRCSGVYPNHYTFSAVLSACTDTMASVHGDQMHSLIWKHGFHADVFVASALLDMYAKCCDMCRAEKVFEEMPLRNLVSWNSMIVGFLQNKLYDRAILFFKTLLLESLTAVDEVSFSSALSACANVGNWEFGKQVHGVALKLGVRNLVYVNNSLIDMYSKCGLFDDVVKLFSNIGARDVVTWNIMIMACVYNNNYEDACNNFWMMRREGLIPDEASYSSVLHSCANLAALYQGALIHNQIIKSGFVKNLCVASSLVTMYAKCGSLVDAFQIFEETVDRNVVCWTAIIAACQQHGHANQVVELFEQMLREGIKPDYITFVSVLSACSHTGRVEEGFFYFNSMTKVHGIYPGYEHYACIVDLLGRSGQLDRAKRFIELMPIKPDASVWGALLSACRNHSNLEMGKEVAQELFELEPDNPGNYVLLCNILTRNGMLREADEVRRKMEAVGVRKEPGCSWIDIKNSTYVFTVHDKSHEKTQEIYEMLEKVKELVKKKGYVAETEFAINMAKAYKEQSLWYHSEKLALALGLLSLPAGAPIRIKKNLRTCGDCHTVMKFASEVFGREIIVRDISRFHHFTNGICSCGDYW
ncbi:putative pentatricopeptide repeat-containing protein, partial [Cucurbita argyrosperma subsp. argyrosperma]